MAGARAAGINDAARIIVGLPVITTAREVAVWRRLCGLPPAAAVTTAAASAATQADGACSADSKVVRDDASKSGVGDAQQSTNAHAPGSSANALSPEESSSLIEMSKRCAKSTLQRLRREEGVAGAHVMALSPASRRAAIAVFERFKTIKET